jgi:hypothetical protein
MRTMLHSFAAGLFACVLAAAAQAGPVLQFVPDRAKLHGTEELRVDLVLSGLTPGTALSGFDLSLQYDPSVLTLSDVSFGDALGDPNDAAQTVVSVFDEFWAGKLTLAEVSLLEASALGCLFCVGPYLDELQPEGALLLATLLFQGTGAGVPGSYTVLQFTDLLLADGAGDAIGGVLVKNVAIAIAEPPAAGLLAAALIAAFSTLAARRRRGAAARS